MKTLPFKIIEVDWNTTNDENHTTDCLYCAYGDSPIYGLNVLLYVGLTTQELKNRIRQHKDSDFNRINNLSWRIGTMGVLAELEKPERERHLKMMESVFITMLKPSYNSSNIKDIDQQLRPGDNLFLILNKGNRGSLPLEISTYWWYKE